MSIVSRCDRFTAAIKRNIPIQGTRGEKELNYTLANRGSLPQSVRCDLQALKAEERVGFGVKAKREAWKLYCATDPKLDVQDLIEFTDTSGILHVADVIMPSSDTAGRGRLFRAVIEESKIET